jgi:hypothetical protein
MYKPAAGLRLFLLNSVILLVLTTGALAAERPPSQVLVEAGWARPQGDLAQEFGGSELGFGAGDGLELGLRWRYYLSRRFSLAPAFHFMDYRDFKSTDAELGDYRLESSSLRYTLELMFVAGVETDLARPFLALAGGLYRNRFNGYDKALVTPIDQSINTLGFAARGGVRLGSFELSAVYNVNRFASWRYFETGREEDYNWDNFSVRAAWIIPFSDGSDTGR